MTQILKRKIKSKNDGRENPIIQCKRPDCDKTFTKYPLRKDGYIVWSRAREYCCPSHASSLTKDQLGDKNSGWRGGKYKQHGYWLVYRPDHREAVNSYVREHRV